MVKGDKSMTGVRMWRTRGHAVDPSRSRVLALLRRLVPVTAEYRGDRFLVREAGRIAVTPLFAVLLLVELTDVLFAVDSVPAVLAVSHEQFIVFSSNAFAIMGLRSLYFLLADMRARFSYLQQGLAVILGWVMPWPRPGPDHVLQNRGRPGPAGP